MITVSQEVHLFYYYCTIICEVIWISNWNKLAQQVMNWTQPKRCLFHYKCGYKLCFFLPFSKRTFITVIYLFIFFIFENKIKDLAHLAAILEKQEIYFSRRFYHFSPQTAHDAWWKIVIEVYGIWFWTQLGFACLSSLIDLRIILRCFSPCLSFP